MRRNRFGGFGEAFVLVGVLLLIGYVADYFLLQVPAGIQADPLLAYLGIGFMVFGFVMIVAWGSLKNRVL